MYDGEVCTVMQLVVCPGKDWMSYYWTGKTWILVDRIFGFSILDPVDPTRNEMHGN